MFNYERISWPRASFWFLTSVVFCLILGEVILVSLAHRFSALETVLFSGFQLVVTLSLGWKLAAAGQRQEAEAGRQQYMAQALGHLQEMKRSVERLQVLVSTKRRALDEPKPREGPPLPVVREYFDHLFSVTEELRGSLIGAIETLSGPADRAVQRQQMISQLETEIADLKNQLQQERVTVSANGGEERPGLAELYEQERARLQSHLETLQEFFGMGGPGEPLANRLLRNGLVRRPRVYANGESRHRPASYS